MKLSHQLELTVRPQTDNTTCGPTCLEAIYRYYDHTVDLGEIVEEVVSLPGGGSCC